MLISKIVKIKQNSKIYKHYVDLGYEYTKMGDEFDIKVEDLTNGSNAEILVKCDYCGQTYNTLYYRYYNAKKKLIKKDCCNSPFCTGLKAQETICKKYNVDNFRQIPGVNKKIKQTNIEKYGCDNPFGNKDIQEKIYKTNLEKYGVQHCTQSKEIQEKYKKTCLERFGVDNYSKTEEFRHSVQGKNSPVQKGDNTLVERTERTMFGYRQQRKAVYERDNYTCQCCKRVNTDENNIHLETHHLNCFKDFPEERMDINNGITLCRKCHKAFHSKYGIKHTTKEQFYEFLKDINENVC